jgi:amino acid adenylation domain-containing protein
MPVVFTSILPDETRNAPNPMAWMGNLVYAISQTPQVWLDHMVFEDAGELLIKWDAVEGLFPAGLLDDMFDAYCRLLRCLADEEYGWQESRFDMLYKLVPPAQLEQRALINSTEATVSSDLLHSPFFDQARLRPDQLAVITPKLMLSYQELNRRVNQVGNWLRQNEVRPNTLVGVVMEKGWEQVVGVLGVLASGAAYLPIDATLPTERLSYILKHGQVSLVLTQSWYDTEIEWPEGIRRLCVDQADLLGLTDSSLEPVQQPEDLAYVIYTSGSTGLPKGVMIDHRGAVNTIQDINQRFEVKAEDRVLALSALNFDLSVYDVFGLLAAGGTIVIPEAFSERNPAHWAELMVKHDVTLWDTVPALMQMLVEYMAGRSEALPDSLRLVMMSGDWIPIDLPARIKNMAVDVTVVSLGGATEASIWSILYPIEQVEPTGMSIPYGRPMINQSFQVLNDTLAPCPVWVPGQLYIGGIGLAKGYWRDEEKTQNSFITHPYTGERLYKTGDVGRYLPDGNIEFLGREDFQVKIRGHRIELGEIETALLHHPDVDKVVVTAAGEIRGNKRLVAYVVPVRDVADAEQGMEEGSASNELKISSTSSVSPEPLGGGELAEELRRFLEGKLPGYMIPASFVMLHALPLSANGKVDRKALPKPESIVVKDSTVHAEPKSEMERVLAGIWQEILGIENIGVNENIFELGGDSVKVIQIIARANQVGIQISPAHIFEHQTIAELATVHGAVRDAFTTSIKPITRQARHGERRPVG